VDGGIIRFPFFFRFHFFDSISCAEKRRGQTYIHIHIHVCVCVRVCVCVCVCICACSLNLFINDFIYLIDLINTCRQ